MKKLFPIIFIALFSISANAQDTSFGVVAGYHSLGQKVSIDVASVTVNTSGFYVGFFADFSISESLNLQPELQFASVSQDGESLNELIIPIMFKYAVSEQFSLMAGPQLDFLLEDTGDEANALGFGIGFGAAYDISDHVFISSRYALGLNNRIKDDLFDSSLKLNTFQIGLGYKF